uniref:SKA complex subunit 1 n=1 Tax=Clastoptera arizonana TaxID=38151 RepID=A0A1B6DS67_9HEMI
MILLEKLKNAEEFLHYLENNIPESTEHVNTPSFNGQSKEETLFYNLLNKKRAQGEVSPYPSNWSTFLATPKENIQNTPCIKSRKEITSRFCIPHVTSSELIKVPSYMRGRIQLTAINSCIDSFNTTLNKKYDIMKQKKSALKPKDLEMFLSWKEQNNIRNDDNYCTPDDLINIAGFKMDKAAYNIITILRHLKRLQEVKLKGMKSRYIVIDS